MRKWFAIVLALALLMTLCLAENASESVPSVQELAGADCDALLTGDYAAVAARFDGNMAAVLDAEGLAQSWSAVVPLLGEYLGRRLPGLRPTWRFSAAELMICRTIRP